MGNSRFDLLLGNEATGEVFPVEVKSCTLFGEKGAMFPDAVTARGKKHVDHLGQIGQIGRAGILILVQWNRAEWFCLIFIRILSLQKHSGLIWSVLIGRWQRFIGRLNLITRSM